MYLSKPHKHQWVIDIETDSLIPTVIWVLCAKNVLTGEEYTLIDYDSMRNFINEKLEESPTTVFIGHNALRFDVPVINRFLGTRITVARCIDTMLLSMVYSPSFKGGHSLEAWGVRLKYPKIDFNDFSALTEEMKTYCMQDVRLTTRVFVKLTERMRGIGFTDRGCEIEHKAWWIIEKQKKNGFKFNFKDATILYAKLNGICDELRKEIYEHWPPTLECVAEYKQAFKKDGTHTKGYEDHRKRYESLEINPDGSYRAFGYVEFDLGSPTQRLEKLISLGWKPREPTKSGKSWKVTEKGELVPSLEEFLQETPHEGARKLAQWITVNARATMINTWLEAYNEETGCIHGNLWLANTFRYRHSEPNTANAPGVKVGPDKHPLLGLEGGFSYESRNLWTTRDANTRSLVGVDAKGIQFRILANYLDDKEFTDVVLGGDIHEYNRSKTGHGSRHQNKTFGYAALLGAGAAKVGSIFGVSPAMGGRIKNKWISTVPGLKRLYQRLEDELDDGGRITLCDGTRVLVPSPHMVLAYLLQGDESRIMKQAKIYTDLQCRKEKLDILWVGDIHDEWQVDVLNKDVDRFIEIAEACFVKAGKSFNYNIPINSDAKVGKTWAETH